MKSLPLALAFALSLFSLNSRAAELKPSCDLTHSSPSASMVHVPMTETQHGNNTFFRATVDGLNVVVSTKAGLKSAIILIIDAATGETLSSTSGGITQDSFAMLENYYSANSQVTIVTCRLTQSETAAPSDDSLMEQLQADSDDNMTLMTAGCPAPKIWKLCPNGGGAAGSKPGRPIKRCLNKGQSCPLPQ